MATAPFPVAPDSELSHVDWIVKRLIQSPHGLTPPELFLLAVAEGRKMHRNYPYTALRALLEAKKIERRGSRYYGLTR